MSKKIKVTCRETDCSWNKKKRCTLKKVKIMAGASCENMTWEWRKG